MRAHGRIALLLVVAVAMLGAACIIGPKHDDPADLAIPPETDGGSDASGGPFDTSAEDTSILSDTWVATPDVAKSPDGDTQSDAMDGDAPQDADGASDGDALDSDGGG